MVGTLDQFPFPVHPLGFTHLVGACLQFIHKVLDFYQTPHFVCPNRIPESFQSRFDIVEIRNSFEQWPVRQIGQHPLKIAKGKAGPVSQFRIYFVITFAILNKIHHPPIITLCIPVKKLSSGCRNERQHLTVNIFHPGIHQFLADMHRYAQNITLQFRDILKNGMIDPLKHILFLSGFYLV